MRKLHSSCRLPVSYLEWWVKDSTEGARRQGLGNFQSLKTLNFGSPCPRHPLRGAVKGTLWCTTSVHRRLGAEVPSPVTRTLLCPHLASLWPLAQSPNSRFASLAGAVVFLAVNGRPLISRRSCGVFHHIAISQTTLDWPLLRFMPTQGRFFPGTHCIIYYYY